MKEKNAIVMGATGFIGQHLVQELLDNDYKVIVLARDRVKAERLWMTDYVTVIEWDGMELNGFYGLRETGYDVFFFLAWDGVAPEQKNDVCLQIKNITCALNAMELAYKVNCKKFVAAGTVAEYVFCENIIDVNEKPAPSDFYGAAKVSVHYMLDVLARQRAMNFIWAVLPSTYGPGRKGDNIITYTIRTLLKGEKPYYGDLEQLWDFLYVSEVARALRLIGERGIPGKIYGIGSGNYRKLKDYVKEIRDCINPELKLNIGALPEMSKRTFSSCVNTFDLINDTGFQVKVSFGEGIKKTIAGIRKTEDADYAVLEGALGYGKE